MPQRFISYSRTEPARTILFTTGVLTFITQALFVALNFSFVAIPNLVVLSAISGWAVWAAYKNSPRQMSMASFWLFMIWLFSAIGRALAAPDPAQLLWMPMLMVAMCMAVVYIYLSHNRRAGKDV